MRHAPAQLFGCGLAVVFTIASWACDTGPIEVGHDHESGAVEDRALHAIQLDDTTQSELGIRIEVAGPGLISLTTELPGEVQVNGDRMAHVAPRVGGVVRGVYASLGDDVHPGQLLAVLESRDLADAKAAYLASAERLELADATHHREERLWQQKVSSEQDYLDARRGRAEARIEYRAAEQKLLALGLTQPKLDRLAQVHEQTLTEYRLTAPFAGTVIDRHITTGETVSAGSSVFTVADLASVWIDLSVYQKDIGMVRSGQRVRVATDHGEEADLAIDFVQPLVGEDTRTAKARIIAPNPLGIWHPGCFVTATVTTLEATVAVSIRNSAVIRMGDGLDVVFVDTEKGFEARPVELGRRTRDEVEVISGLVAGERYVAAGGFSLKAELGKETFGDGHGH